MGKLFKVLFALIIAVAIICGVAFLIDSSRVAGKNQPYFIIKTINHEDGAIEYVCPGYKIISLNGYKVMNICEKYSPTKIEEKHEEIVQQEIVPEIEENINIEEDIVSGEINEEVIIENVEENDVTEVKESLEEEITLEEDIPVELNVEEIIEEP